MFGETAAKPQRSHISRKCAPFSPLSAASDRASTRHISASLALAGLAAWARSRCSRSGRIGDSGAAGTEHRLISRAAQGFRPLSSLTLRNNTVKLVLHCVHASASASLTHCDGSNATPAMASFGVSVGRRQTEHYGADTMTPRSAAVASHFSAVNVSIMLLLGLTGYVYLSAMWEASGADWDATASLALRDEKIRSLLEANKALRAALPQAAQSNRYLASGQSDGNADSADTVRKRLTMALGLAVIVMCARSSLDGRPTSTDSTA